MKKVIIIVLLAISFLVCFNGVCDYVHEANDTTDYVLYGVTEGQANVLGVYDEEMEARAAELDLTEQYEVTYYMEVTK